MLAKVSTKQAHSNFDHGIVSILSTFLAKIKIFGGHVTDDRVDKILTMKMLLYVFFLLPFTGGIWKSNKNAEIKAEKRGQTTDNEKG